MPYMLQVSEAQATPKPHRKRVQNTKCSGSQSVSIFDVAWIAASRILPVPVVHLLREGSVVLR
jgi:hypothetical protein